MLSAPKPFSKAISAIESLANKEEYEGAFIFGSVARGDTTAHSDLDVQVITVNDNPTLDILHPYVDGIKLDLTFLSYNQLLERTEKEIEEGHLIMFAEAVIVFDKNGRLDQLKERVAKIKPKKVEPKEYPLIQFLTYHANNKVERHLESDPASALLSMHVCINDILKHHYQIHGRWWVSDKRKFADLAAWDPELGNLLKHFVEASDVKEKYRMWSMVIEHVLAPIGGKKSIEENPYVSVVSENGLKDLGGGIV